MLIATLTSNNSKISHLRPMFFTRFLLISLDFFLLKLLKWVRVDFYFLQKFLLVSLECPVRLSPYFFILLILYLLQTAFPSAKKSLLLYFCQFLLLWVRLKPYHWSSIILLKIAFSIKDFYLLLVLVLCRNCRQRFQKWLFAELAFVLKEVTAAPLRFL